MLFEKTSSIFLSYLMSEMTVFWFFVIVVVLFTLSLRDVVSRERREGTEEMLRHEGPPRWW